jgi:hypothetical protein
LTDQLHASDLETRELAARTIIEEVVGSKYMGLRLKALDNLIVSDIWKFGFSLFIKMPKEVIKTRRYV